jgi:hypothetical protein
MERDVALLRHFLAALAYRTQKALRDAPANFAEFRIAPGVRTPCELIRHMTSVLGYARTFQIGGAFTADALPDLQAEVNRFHQMLNDISCDLLDGKVFVDMSTEAVLQGPFCDAMTHAGQLALLRRLAGSPVPAENFLKADIDAANVTATQSEPKSPGRRDGKWDPRGVTDDNSPA